MADITFILNSKAITVEAGTTVLEAAQTNGVKIPTLCHDPRLSSSGSCRLCIVEVKGMRNLPASCVTEVTKDMEVETHSPAVLEARRTIIELLLANHPVDCMTCQKSGDCKLQDYAYEYQVRESNFGGERHAYPLDDSNPYILRDANKCILCGKCVRACDEIKGQCVIDFTQRGFNTKIAPAFDASLKGSDCVYCNNCVAVCPTGALLDKRLVGKGRCWEITKQAVTCMFCDAGCQFEVNSKNGKVIGITAKAADNGRPLCLKGRLGLDFLNNDQAEPPMLMKDGEFVVVPWEEALGLALVFEKLRELKNNAN
ncbi:MAG: 2Fe-2S iron-sulfur cluster-binding protein [Desulfitobacteriaceae bacterium]